MRLVTPLALILAGSVMGARSLPAQTDPLPSWNQGAARHAIVAFVGRVTKKGPDYISPAERIAVFDNDGTLWAEQPAYAQLFFLVDRLKALAPQHPEWQEQQPFKAALMGDWKTVGESGMKGIGQLAAATHSGMTTEEFEQQVTQWITTAKHPTKHRLYTELVYRPMLEVLAYLRANGFKTYIVSGGGIEFMRPWTLRVYGIPPEQVVGTSGGLQYQVRDGKPVILKLPQVDLVDDGPGKPVGIQRLIGRRPIIAFGNSDGDREMLEWTASGPGARLAVLIHHTDATREWAYDRDSKIGHLDKALDQAQRDGWTVVSMKEDWKRVFGFER